MCISINFICSDYNTKEREDGNDQFTLKVFIRVRIRRRYSFEVIRIHHRIDQIENTNPLCQLYFLKPKNASQF